MSRLGPYVLAFIFASFPLALPQLLTLPLFFFIFYFFLFFTPRSLLLCEFLRFALRHIAFGSLSTSVMRGMFLVQSYA
jgi:tellurite resistance protein TehA-like permease